MIVIEIIVKLFVISKFKCIDYIWTCTPTYTSVSYPYLTNFHVVHGKDYFAIVTGVTPTTHTAHNKKTREVKTN